MDFHSQYESSYDEQNRLDGLVLVALSFGNKTKHTTSRFRNPSRSDREQTPDSVLLEQFRLIAHNCKIKICHFRVNSVHGRSHAMS